MGLPRYLAASRVDDPEHTAFLVHELIAAHDNGGMVCLLQVGRASPLARTMASQLEKVGRRAKHVVVRDRETAQADATLSAVALSCAVWVFADDLLEAFLVLFATQLAFGLRARSRAGLPVIGVGGGALALGGLLLASRVCQRSQYDLVGGLGWAPRVLLDGDVVGHAGNPSIARATVRSLPALLGLELGSAGAVRVQGGRVESVGSEPVLLVGAEGEGGLLTMPLEPGVARTLAPPPFAPFERRLLPAETLRALSGRPATRPTSAVPALPAGLSQAPPPPEVVPDAETDSENPHAAGRVCPMCQQLHRSDSPIELAA